MAVINAEGLVLGRMASVVAKRLLNGEEIVILRAEKAKLIGSEKAIFEEYRHRVKRGGLRKGPYFPRLPDRIVRRTIRGMLPYQKPRGREAYKRLRVYIGVPSEFDGMGMESIEDARERVGTRCIEVGEVSKAIGTDFE